MPAANAYVQLAEDTARRITHSHTEWTGFLKTAARLYKYPYHEQLMIYAQRPEATACADYRVWNDRMRRYIRRGSKGIALLDVSGDEPKLRYVFDIADTGTRAASRPFAQWQLTEQNEEAARRALEDGYDVTGSLEKQIHAAVQQMVMNQWLDHRREILGIVDGSYLEGYDEFNVGASFRKAAAISAEYALLSRCGRNPDERFVHEDFLPIFDWNTPEAVTVLGTAVSEMSEEILRTIEIAVRNHERSQEYEPNYLSAKRGLPASQPDRGENGEAAGPVRPDAENLPEESPVHAVPIHASDGKAVSAPAGDRGNGEQPDGAAPAAADGTVRSDGAAQSRRYDEVGRNDEQLQDPGRGNDSERTDLQLNQTVQLSFFPTEEAQIAQIDHAESVQPSAFSFVASVADSVHENRFIIEEPQTQAAVLPDSPQYHLQDTVYLDQTAFLITEITDRHVQLQDPSLRYPIFRVENRETFEALLRLDSRNQVSGEANRPISNEAAEDAVSSPQRENLPMENFRITDDHLGEGGAKTRYGWNLAAIRTLRQLEAENRPAAPDEQEILSRYVGWGGLPQAFDPQNSDWNKEYEELKGLLSESEYASARASTLNAHYTSPTVIRAMYEAIGRMGFTSGNILEPACGVGNFFGLLPDTMAGSRLYGIELDSLTGRIARQLYPQANITVAGFETTNRRDFYDLAIGNVPFGNYQVSDKPYDKLHFPIHDYFFAKALDQVRPGGVVAFITSKGTMDKQNPDVRRYIARRAELLGAVRLPNNAFKANAGTEVTSDILFLQKRERPIDIEPDWVHLSVTEDGIPLNAYFAEHSEMVLGRMIWDDSMYGSRQETACLPIEGAELSQQLAAAMQNITGQITEVELPDLAEDTMMDMSLPADPDVKNFSYTVVESEVYYRENSRMLHQELSEAAKERVKGLVGLRDCVLSLIDQQMENAPDEIIQQSQSVLNRLYDDFTAQYGLINGRSNASAFASDSSYYLLCSLEILDENHQLSRKADLFSKRTIRPAQAVEHVDTAAEALAVSIAEKATVDLPFMAELTGKSEEEIASDLTGVIFRLPAPVDDEGKPRYVTADEYLSGNVRQKLRDARAAADLSPIFEPNVKALEKAQPKELDASEIDVRLGATWVDKEYIQQFMHELFEVPFYQRRAVQVQYSNFTSEWRISGKTSLSYNNVPNNLTYGTDRGSGLRILEDTLNLRDVRIYDTIEDADGKEKRVLNQKATTLAQQKQQAIKDAFRDWVWKDPDRREALVKKYNELFNSVRPREYDGQHITFSGMNPEITLREHQRNAIAHTLYGGNTLLAHVVGAGKSATRS